MAAAIESRVPFMDYRLVEWANRLPVQLKVTGGGGKALVKELARTLLPAEVVDRRKSGFGVPLARWFRERNGMGERIVALPDSPNADVFDRALPPAAGHRARERAARPLGAAVDRAQCHHLAR